MAILNALPYIHSANIISSYACLLNHQSKAAIPYISLSLSTWQCPWFLKSASSLFHLIRTLSSPSAHSLSDLFIFRSLCVWTYQFIGSVHDFPLPQLPQIFLFRSHFLLNVQLNKIFLRVMMWTKTGSHGLCLILYTKFLEGRILVWISITQHQ